MISYGWLSRSAIVCLIVLAFIPARVLALGELELINQNPSFEEDYTGWEQYIDAAAGAVFDISKEAFEGKKCAHINVTKISGTNWHVGLTQGNLTLEAGQMYTADFLARADAKRIITIEVKRQPGLGDWEGITEQDTIISDKWDDYFVTFTPAKDYDKAAFLAFWLGQEKGNVWIDGARLYEGKKQERQGIVSPKNVGANGKLITLWAAIKANE